MNPTLFPVPVKPKPILLSTLEVQAILEGRKTQARWVVKPQPELNSNGTYNWEFRKVSCQNSPLETLLNPIIGAPAYAKYKPGDILWVRETWAFDAVHGYVYRADENCPVLPIWKPSIHMPREAARLFMRVTNVRVERLKKISSEDCFAEGVGGEDDDDYNMAEHYQSGGSSIQGGTPEHFAFIGIWCGAYGPGSWDANPWVWVYEFERCEKP